MTETTTPQNLQGPCSKCGGYFPDLIAHYEAMHAVKETPSHEQKTPPYGFQTVQPQPQVPEGYVMVPVESLYQESPAPKGNLASRIWNYEVISKKTPGVCPQCNRFVDDLRAHQEWHDSRHWIVRAATKKF